MEFTASVWLVLLLALAAATAALAAPRRTARAAGWPVEELYADQVALAAEQAAAIARRRRADWARAQDEVDAAWAAFDAADRAARKSVTAAAFPVLKQRRTRAELADRERDLHRRATAACRRRELSIAQLNEVLAHRGGWNPRRHPVAQEAALRAAVREHRFALYRAATDRERRAWQDAERAAATVRGLRAEALAVQSRAGQDVRHPQRWTPTRPAKARIAVHRARALRASS
ncbi:hypothetical protein BJ971_001616 [Actinoplanes digitatis]|uniref:Secreted protein n=1 Tax=Actinoplanes digitatis TaxID=1868 RepID=A0A7W7MP02_9ACTN|nr:hypothetical protein [Actinoplanes digitatis]BFE69404.1 hypothetical protein GCM10020092_027050 [Actinoplanes digitatis]